MLDDCRARSVCESLVLHIEGRRTCVITLLWGIFFIHFFVFFLYILNLDER